MDIEATV